MGCKTCTVRFKHIALPHVQRVLDSVSSSLKQTQCCDLWLCSWRLSAGLLRIQSSYLLAARMCSPALSPTPASLWTAPPLPPPVAGASACADWTASAASFFSYWDLNPLQIEALVCLKSVRSSPYSSLLQWDSAPFSKTCSERFCTLSDTSLFFVVFCSTSRVLAVSSLSLFSSPCSRSLSLTLSELCSLVPRQYFVGFFSPGADPRGAFCSESERLWIQHQPSLSLSLSPFPHPWFCYLSATSGGEWNRSWSSCQHQALSLVHEGSWGTTVWTYHWNLK